MTTDYHHLERETFLPGADLWAGTRRSLENLISVHFWHSFLYVPETSALLSSPPHRRGKTVWDEHHN